MAIPQTPFLFNILFSCHSVSQGLEGWWGEQSHAHPRLSGWWEQAGSVLYTIEILADAPTDRGKNSSGLGLQFCKFLSHMQRTGLVKLTQWIPLPQGRDNCISVIPGSCLSHLPLKTSSAGDYTILSDNLLCASQSLPLKTLYYLLDISQGMVSSSLYLSFRTWVRVEKFIPKCSFPNIQCALHAVLLHLGEAEHMLFILWTLTYITGGVTAHSVSRASGLFQTLHKGALNNKKN